MSLTIESITILYIGGDSRGAEPIERRLADDDDRVEVVPEATAEAGLDRLSESAIDSVVVDQRRIDSSGADLFEAVRSVAPELPFVLVASEHDSIPEELLSASATEYVLETDEGTVRFDLLAGRIETVLELARSRSTLAERNRQLDTLVDNVPGMVYRCENAPDWPMEYVGGECEALTGYTAEELENGSVRWGEDLLAPEDRERLWETIQAAIETGEPFELTYPITTADGETRWVWERGRSIDGRQRLDRGEEVDGREENGSNGDENETVEAIEGVITDVTDLKTRERELERQSKRFSKLFEQFPEPTIAYRYENGEPHVVSVNEAFVEVFGYDEARAVGEPIDDLVVPSDRREEALEIDERVKSGEAVDRELRRQTADGIREFRFRNVRLEDDEEIDGFAIYADVTAQKQRQRELERYRTLVETIGDPMYVLDAEGTVTMVNEAAVDTWGYDREKLIGMHASEILPEEDYQRGTERIVELLEDEEKRWATFEMRSETADGERMVNENKIAVLTDDAGELVGSVGVIRDITERKNYERELEAQNDRLEEFASIVSHDLRNPLNVATGRLRLAREEHDSEHLEVADRSLARMEALIDDLLTLARYGTEVTEPEPLALDAIASTCWETVATDAAELVVETGRTIRADRSQFRQLLENLIRNSIEHGGEDVTVRIGTDDWGLYIEDDGTGIPADEREQIFETGYSTARDGTGFGLSIVQQVADAHGWTVEVTESARGGARFEIHGIEFVD